MCFTGSREPTHLTLLCATHSLVDILFPGSNQARLYILTICPLRTYNLLMSKDEKMSPLTPAVFYILLALASGDKHGYEIMKQVKKDAGNSVKMGNGTLYGSLKRMLADQLIEDTG